MAENSQEILTIFRKIYQGNSTNTYYDKILLQHGCLFLLLKQGKAQKTYFINKTINNIRYTSCSGVLQKLISVPYAVIKGAVLAKHAYGDENMRLSNDIDLLISRTSYDEVKEVLISEGFTQGVVRSGEIIPYSREEIIYHMTQTHQAATFVKQTGNKLSPYVFVDVNFDIFWGDSCTHTDIGEILQKTHQETICGQLINVFNPLEEFIAMCLHHYKHMNSIYLLMEDGMQLYLLCDIFEYLQKNKLDPEQLRKCSEKWGALPFVYYCVYYANELLGNALLDQYVSALISPDGEVIIDCIGLNGSERRKVKSSFWDRMLSNNLTKLLANDLREDDYRKVDVNHKYLKGL